MGNIIIRVDDKKKVGYETAAKAAGLSLSVWLRSLADNAAGFADSTGGAGEKMRPFDPAGPEVVTEPVKQRKPRKKSAEKVVTIEKATGCGPTVAGMKPPAPVGGAPGAGGGVDRRYTGESAIMNGIPMYEYRAPGSERTRWTIDPPPQKK